ncbi:condensation domain-containing protein, partial [Planosporangium sp. 12N6]|uniref:condensation domain-containing protein n=1 Tax=Planosporangium spinosum TaxID=3402278 RepID=UPI003CEFFCB3
MTRSARDNAHRTSRSTPAWDEQREHWRKLLEGAVPAELPATGAAPTGPGATAAHAFAVPAGTAARLADLTGRHGIAPLELAVAAVQTVLGYYAGTDDVTVATMADQPDRPANPVLLRSDLPATATVLDLLRHVRATVRAALAHADVPFPRLVEELRLDADLARVTVVRGTVAVPTTTQLTVRLAEPAADLSGAVEYRTDRLDPATVERFAGHVVRVLEAIADDPSVPIRDLDLLSVAERSRVLHAWNDTGDGVVPVSLAGLFGAAVCRWPGAPALVDGEVTVSFAEL